MICKVTSNPNPSVIQGRRGQTQRHDISKHPLFWPEMPAEDDKLQQVSSRHTIPPPAPRSEEIRDTTTTPCQIKNKEIIIFLKKVKNYLLKRL